MKPHEDDQTPSVESARQTQAQEIIPAPPRRPSPAAVVSAVAPTMDMRATMDSLELVNSIRESVVRDIVEKDSAHLAELLHARVSERLTEHNSRLVKSTVAAELADRVKVFGALTGAATLVLGLVGYTSMRDALTTAARSEAAEQAALKAREAFEGEREMLETRRKSLDTVLERGEKRVETAADKAVSNANEASMGLTQDVSKALRDFNTQIDLKSASSIAAAEASIRAAREAAHVELKSELTTSRAALTTATTEALQRVNDTATRFGKSLDVTVADEVRRQLRAQRPISTSASDASPLAKASQGAANSPHRQHLERIVERDAARSFEYATLREMASSIDPELDAEMQRYLLDPILCYPRHYLPADRAATARTLLSPQVPSSERRGAAIEVMISALRVRDQELFETGRQSLASNLYTRLLTHDDFADCAQVAMAQPDSDAARAAFDAVDVSELTLKGRINLLALGKRAGVGDQLAPLQERVLGELFVASADDEPAYLDRWSDYPHAAFVVDVLLADPVIDRPRVGESLERIRGLVFRADDDPDPFGLRKRIDEFLGQ